VSLEASSSLRRSGQRDERRRRLLTDDLSSQDDGQTCRVWSENGCAQQSVNHYGNAEFLDNQWQLLDLVPRRVLVLTLLLLAGIAIIAGLEFAYQWMAEHVAAGGTIAVALDIGLKGSLACWFSSLTLLAASVAALLVYTVRRHRTDDYQGRYRVWRWAAGFWLLLATDQAASLREGFRDAMIALTGTPLLGNGSLWWVAVYVLVFGAIGSRLLMDMRPARLSIAALAASGIAYGLAAACWLGFPLVKGGAGETMFRVGCEMAGCLMLLTAMGLHARYVLLDAEGLLPHPEPEAEEKAEEDDEEELNNEVKVISSAKQWRAVDPPHVAPPPTCQKPAPPPAAKPAAAPASTFDPPTVNRKLTKGERKALKDRLLRERREREGLD
jgi:hypothetical protein